MLLEIEPLLAIGFIAVFAAVSIFFRLLKPSGAAAAFGAGALIWEGFGWKGLILIGIFFLSSSLLSKYKQSTKEYLGELHEKGSSRDWAQVLANGGTAALAGLAEFVAPDPVWILVFSISLAAANADTWASELGVLSKQQPVSIKSFKRVPRGTSGAISGFGTAASAGGSLLIALSADFLFEIGTIMTLTIFLLGIAGAMLDTVLGAFIQAKFKCVRCGQRTEKKVHCSVPTSKVSGLTRMNNDAVNFISCFTAAILGLFLFLVL